MVWYKPSCRRRIGTCANGQSWFPRNLGESYFAPRLFPAGDTGLPTPGLGGSLVRQGANLTSEPEVSPNEGDEVRRDGSRMSQRFDSTDEAGELALEDPVEESEASASRLNGGKHAEHIEVHPHVHVTSLNSFRGRKDGESVG
jgi:hypothetical protein